jgi:ankyrin repeat protein
MSHNDNGNNYDKSGKTPFLSAVEKGYKEIMSLLLERGAEINATDQVLYRNDSGSFSSIL